MVKVHSNYYYGKKRRYAKKRASEANRRRKTRMGKMFTTRSGKYGCYKYVNNRRVAFVTKKRRSYKRRKY